MPRAARLLLCLVAATLGPNASAHRPTPDRELDSATDVRVVRLSTRVRDHPNRFDLSTPVRAFVTMQYLKSEGRASQYRAAASYRTRGFYPPADAPDEAVTPDRRRSMLETPILALLLYGEDVAAVITPFQDAMFLVTYLTRERGEWRHAGEDLGNDFDNACAVFRTKARNFALIAARIARLRSVSATDDRVAAFLRERGQAPESLILDALAAHRVVIYGEVHRRRASWDLLRTIVARPEFTDRVGTLFLELSSDAQPVLDAFFASEQPAPDALWRVFQNTQIDGWYDRGLFEFLNDLRVRQRRLPPDRRLRVVAVDQARPFAELVTAEQMVRFFSAGADRNSQMATRILDTLRIPRDGRHALFIVGVGHVFKSKAPGFGDSRRSPLSAAARLVQALGPGQVFTIWQHAPIIGNDGTIHGLIREGVLDRAFRRLGDRPVAFRVAGSPLANEPFDGLFETMYAGEVGAWATNYDAYLFLGPLGTEPPDYLFSDHVTDAFVVELKRRAALVNTTVERWFGVGEATKEAIVESIAARTNAPRRWQTLLGVSTLPSSCEASTGPCRYRAGGRGSSCSSRSEDHNARWLPPVAFFSAAAWL
jgi:hypothetical protein